MPRFILLLHGDSTSETHPLPTKAHLTRMHAFNASLASAGILLWAEGLHPTSRGAARVTFPPTSADTTSSNLDTVKSEIEVQNGPFGCAVGGNGGEGEEGKGPICGFWIVEMKSLEEALEWVRKAPLEGRTVEIREVFVCDGSARGE